MNRFTMEERTPDDEVIQVKMKKALDELIQERARSYQIEMFEYAKNNNTIVCLGTGTGKTFVSVLLIKHFEHQVTGTWMENGQVVGKRTIFLAPNVPLVEQQSAVIAQHMTVKVGTYIGAMQTDRWNKDNWNKECSDYGILVMTPEIFRLIVQHSLIPFENINLLVLDECHAATGGHPYFEIMKKYKEYPASQRPRILGLTASVVNSQVHGFHVAQKVRELEATLSSTAKTSSSTIAQFGTKPSEVVVLHEDTPYDELPIDEEKLNLLKDCADFKEFKKALAAMKNLYLACGPFCTKILIEFRERELEKAINHPDCAEGFKNSVHIRREIYNEIREFVGEQPSIDDIPPKLQRLLNILELFKDGLSGIVFVKERLTAYVLYVWMSYMSKRNEWSFIRPSFIVGQTNSSYGRDLDYDSFKMNSKAQHKVMKDFRNDEYNLMFATSVIEEGMDVPVCNAIIRFDPPFDVRSYTQSKGRARAKPSLYVILATASERARVEALMDSYQETEKLVMLCCRQDRGGPNVDETNQVFEEDPNLPPFIVESTGARITSQSAIGMLHWYCQQFMRNAYPNIMPYFNYEETPEGYICTLQMPLISRMREIVSNADLPFKNKHDARAYVCMEMCKKLYACGELTDHLLPKRRIDSLFALGLEPKDKAIDNELKKVTVTSGPKLNEKRRYILPRARAEPLKTRTETIDCEPQETFHLYSFRSKVVKWASRKQNRANEKLFDPEKYPIGVGLILKDKCDQIEALPQFSVYTRSGEERVEIIYEGPVQLGETEKNLCSRFNRYVFYLVLEIQDNFTILDAEDGKPLFASPCVVAVKETGENSFELDMDTMSSIGPPELPDFNNFEINEEIYEDAVVELLFHINENLPEHSREYHTRIPTDFYPRFIVRETRAKDKDGEPLTPHSKGCYKFDMKMSLAEYAFGRCLRAGTGKILSDTQPILRVEHVPLRLRMTTPRFDNGPKKAAPSKDGDNNNDKSEEKEDDDDEDFDDVSQKINFGRTSYIVSQFAAVHKIKGSLWRKLASFPSMFYRLNRLLLAENIRQKIAISSKIGPVHPEKGQWKPLVVERVVKECIESKPMREINRLLVAGDRSFDKSALKLSLLHQPDLKTCVGPSPGDIMKALSTKATVEIFDLERLELLGDAFLYIVATFATYDRKHKCTIRELNNYRQFQVTNKHLLYRAYEHGLTSALEVLMFLPSINFLPPGYKPLQEEEKLLDRNFLNLFFENYGFDIGSFLNVKNLRFVCLPREMIESLKSLTFEEFEIELKRTTTQDSDLPPARELPVKTFHTLKAKVGGDVVEALIGTYLEKCGPVGAMRFLKWIGIDYGDVKSDNFLDAFQLDFSETQAVEDSKVERYRHLIDKVEDCLDYKFKSVALALEAITHHSYREHLITYDNTRLAFIGESIVDYLLTLYIYRLNSNLSPGQLTDLRCALVNSHIAAHAVVHSGLHTVLLYTNTKLFSTIKKYLSNIEEIGLRMNTVIGDWETENSEEAEIPRPLARLLHALLAAIFIDTGKDLNEVWRILVHIMGYEISLLTTHVPLSPVSELLQKFPGTSFSKPVQIYDGEDKDKVEVTMYLQLPEGNVEKYSEVAETKKAAKTILAKRYLRKLEIEERMQVIEERKASNQEEKSVTTQCDVLLESELLKSKFYRKK